MTDLAPATLAGPNDYVSHDYGTPPPFVEITHAVFNGPPTVDPFSSEKWNATGFRAERIITEAMDGFKTPWFPACDRDDNCRLDPGHAGRCDYVAWRAGTPGHGPTAAVNPPGNKSGTNAKRVWSLLGGHYMNLRCSGGAVWVGFNLNQFQTLQHGPVTPFDPRFIRCVPRKRVAYLEGPGVLTTAPRAPSWLLLMPSRHPDRGAEQRRIFTDLASKLGAVF